MSEPTPTPESPWAILDITRKQYAAARPWKKAGMSKEKYAEMLNLMPHEADAERLLEGIFGLQRK
jgi:hypothetical protein